MVKPELINERPIDMVELKSEIDSIKKRDKKLGFRSNQTDDYLSQFVTLPLKKSQELRKKLEDLKISRLKEEIIVKVIDTLPTTLDELKTLLQGYVASINQEDLKKIIAVVNEFIPAKKK